MLLIILLMFLLAVAFYASIIGLIAWGLQFAILNFTVRRMRPLRWLMLAPSVLALLWSTVSPISYIWGGLAIAVFVGWASAWVVYKFICGGDPDEKTDPSL